MLSHFLLAASAAASASAALTRRVACPDGVNTATNGACCVWYAVRDDLQANLFNNECQAEVHETLRASFHDAIGFSPALAQQGKFAGGGADGSLIQFGPSDEFAFPANEGLEDISLELKKFADKHNVTYGDIIQFATAVGVTNCQAAPQITTFVGRSPPNAASPPGLVPLPTDSVNSILSRFDDAGISVANAIWLLASHSIAGQNHVDESVQGTPFDSTPTVFDSQFFLEVILKGTSLPGSSQQPGEAEAPIKGEFRLQSDFLLARDPQTCGLWSLPINNVGFIQGVFSAAMTQMSLLGQNVTALTDCTEVIPTSKGSPQAVTYPPGLSAADLDFNCSSTITDLDTQPGSPSDLPPIPLPTFS